MNDFKLGSIVYVKPFVRGVYIAKIYRVNNKLANGYDCRMFIDDQCKLIAIETEDIIGIVPDGIYRTIYQNLIGSVEQKGVCKVKDGQVQAVQYNNNWIPYESAPIIIYAVYEKTVNNLNFSNKKVQLEEGLFL